jgi:hypothetical protein
VTMLYSTCDNYIIQFSAAMSGILANPNNINMKISDVVSQADISALQACARIELRIGAQFTAPPAIGLFDVSAATTTAATANTVTTTTREAGGGTAVLLPDGSPVATGRPMVEST